MCSATDHYMEYIQKYYSKESKTDKFETAEDYVNSLKWQRSKTKDDCEQIIQDENNYYSNYYTFLDINGNYHYYITIVDLLIDVGYDTRQSIEAELEHIDEVQYRFIKFPDELMSTDGTINYEIEYDWFTIGEILNLSIYDQEYATGLSDLEMEGWDYLDRIV